MLNKLIMRLAHEKWDMKFILEEDTDGSHQINEDHTAYLYREGHANWNGVIVSIPQTLMNITTIEGLEESLDSLYTDALFEQLDVDGVLFDELQDMVCMKVWLESLWLENKLMFLDKGKEGFEICTIDDKNKYTFMKSDRDNNWSIENKPSNDMLVRLSSGNKGKELSIVTSNEHWSIEIDSLNARVHVPMDVISPKTLHRYFIEGNNVTQVTVDGRNREWTIQTTQYSINKEGIIVRETLECPSNVVPTNTLEKLCKRLYMGDSPVLTDGEREFITSSNAKLLSPLYNGKQLFVGHQEIVTYMNFPGVGWIPVSEVAMFMDDLPQGIKDEIALYKNL